LCPAINLRVDPTKEEWLLQDIKSPMLFFADLVYFLTDFALAGC
jgi:hypothetical protein